MLGHIIKNYINDKGLIQSRIAKKAGIPISTFNDILNGRRKLDAVEYFYICCALEVSIDYFKDKYMEACTDK